MSKCLRMERTAEMTILSYERQSLFCVRPRQIKWDSTDVSF